MITHSYMLNIRVGIALCFTIVGRIYHTNLATIIHNNSFVHGECQTANTDKDVQNKKENLN